MALVFAALFIIVLTFIIFVLWIFLSPKPAALLLRRGVDPPPDYLPDYIEKIKNINIIKNLTYPSSSGKNNLDLYLPNARSGNNPVIVWVHGGAFVAGDKAGTQSWASCLASEGIAVACMNYEWAPEAAWPTQVMQVCDCLNFLKSDAEKYNLSMSNFVIAGDSAGAHMAAQLALIHTCPEFQNEIGLLPCLNNGELKATLLYCGPYDIEMMANPKSKILKYIFSSIGWAYLGKRKWKNTEKAKLMNIKNYITDSFPPSYVTDGNCNSFEAQGKALVKALESKGVFVKSRFFNKESGDVTHGYEFKMSTPCACQCYHDTIDFLRQINFI